MSKRIVIIDGHPDASAERFVRALVHAYQAAAEQAGHEVRVLRLADLSFPLLLANKDFLDGDPPPVIKDAQAQLLWSDHVAIFYPLWLGSMPALLKGFLEQLMRPGFAFAKGNGLKLPKKLLAGRSARIVVTMGMPALFYRWYFRAHSLKSLERNILAFVGFRPIRATIVGSVEASAAKRGRWLESMRQYGAAGR